MKKLLKGLAFAALIFALMLTGTGVAVAATVVRTGIVMVEVEEKGPNGVHIIIPVPAALIRFGAAVVPRFAEDRDLADARRELGKVQPMVRGLTRELLDAPSFTLVEVTTSTEQVSVVKDGASLVVDVDSEDARVHVSLPIDLADKVISSLAG